jgi:hypothetical protein
MRNGGILLLFTLAPLWAQDIKLPADLDKLAAKAVETAEVTLDGRLLQLAAKFLSSDKPDEARAKSLITGLKGIYVRSYEFDKTGEYSPADIEPIRSQLRAPAWSRIVGVVDRHGDGEKAEVFLKTDGDKIGGLVILCSEPKELTIVNIVGNIDLDQLSDLGGQFGIPNVKVEKNKKPAGKD